MHNTPQCVHCLCPVYQSRARARARLCVRCPCCLHVQVKCFLIVNKIRFNSISMLAHGKIIIVQDIIGVKSSILKSKHHRPLACCVSHLCLIDMLMHKAFILFWIPFVFSFSSFFFIQFHSHCEIQSIDYILDARKTQNTKMVLRHC